MLTHHLFGFAVPVIHDQSALMKLLMVASFLLWFILPSVAEPGFGRTTNDPQSANISSIQRPRIGRDGTFQFQLFGKLQRPWPFKALRIWIFAFQDLSLLRNQDALDETCRDDNSDRQRQIGRASCRERV